MSEPIPVFAVLLAAGESTRFGAENKLLADVGGQPLVARAVACATGANVTGVYVVVAPGEQGEAVTAALKGQTVRIVVNANASRGMGTSIACGVAAVPQLEAGIMISPADMPFLDTALLDRLVAAFQAAKGERIVYPVSSTGEQRNPVIWPAWARPALLQLDGAGGGKTLLERHAARTLSIAADRDRAFEDIDTKEDLARIADHSSE